MKLILPLSRICVRMLLKACIVHCSRHLIAVPQQVSVKSFLYSQTVILKTDSKILYYSILKLKYSPFIFKAQQRLIERCFVNSQNNCHRNYTNGIFLQIHMFRSIDLCILRDACHELFWIFGDSSASGTQHAARRGNNITAYMGVWSPTLVMLQTHLEMVFWWKPLLMHTIK